MSISDIKKQISPILKRNGVEKAAVFGSFARGEAKRKSDVDILIKFRGNNKSLFDLTGLQLELEEKLKRNVDILTYNSLHPFLRKDVLSEQKIIL